MGREARREKPVVETEPVTFTIIKIASAAGGEEFPIIEDRGDYFRRTAGEIFIHLDKQGRDIWINPTNLIKYEEQRAIWDRPVEKSKLEQMSEGPAIQPPTGTESQ